jgi:predicted transcriptional regulator
MSASLESSGRYRSLLISLHPRFAEPVLDGSAAIVVRRTRIGAPGGTLLILCATAPTKAVVGVATLRRQDTDLAEAIWCRHEHDMAMHREEFDAYLAGASRATALVLTAPRQLRRPARLPISASPTKHRSARRPATRFLTPADPDTLLRLASAGGPPAMSASGACCQ